jgi:DNA-binding LytR/AlgR family response regulator
MADREPPRKPAITNGRDRRARERHHIPPAVWLRDGTTRIRLEPRDVLWISSAGNYVEYSLADGSSHLIRGTLAAAQAEFGRFNLVRVHRTRLANLNRVTSVEFKPSGDFDLTFDTGKTVQGSRRYKITVEALDRSTASARSSPADRSGQPITPNFQPVTKIPRGK